MTEPVPRSYKAVMNEDFDSRMREHRYEASGLELDELKRRAIARLMRRKRLFVSLK